jgi:hypothetical protein
MPFRTLSQRQKLPRIQPLVALLHQAHSYRFPDTHTKAATDAKQEFAISFQLSMSKGNKNPVTTTIDS